MSPQLSSTNEEPAVVRCLAFVFVFAPCLAAAEKVAAVVNGETITVAELDAALAQNPPASTPLSAVQMKQQRTEALQILVDDKLVRQFLKQHGPKVESAEVERQFAALEAGQKAQNRSIEEFLKEANLTVAQIKENFHRMLQLAKYVDTRLASEPLEAYYQANREFFDRTTVRSSQIVLRVGPTAAPMERQKAIDNLKAIRAELGAGKMDFPTAAKAYSQSLNAATGGDVGYIVRKFQTDEAYARAAFALKVGEVSDVVETEIGYHLIWVTDRKAGKATRYEEVAQDVRECCEAELKQSLLLELRKKAKIEIKLP
jgi:parvulin-like peptidyl-prolyl isomerase